MNRVLAEGRDRFRALLASSEDGTRCRELRPLLSAFCDGEASRPGDAEKVREHLRACARCRSTMRAYRAAPRIALGLAPAFPPPRSLFERVQEQLTGLASRLPAELVPVCVGTACVVTGTIPVPLTGHDQAARPQVERSAERLAPAAPSEAARTEPEKPAAQPKTPAEPPPEETAEAAPVPSAPPGDPVQYEPPPPPEPPPPSPPESAPSGSAAGEFGP